MNWSKLLPLFVVAAIMLFRLRRAAKEQPLRIERMWIMPALASLLILASLAFVPTPPSGWLALIAGVLVGAAAGWHRGKLMRIRVEPATGQLFQQASPAATILLIVIVFARTAIRDVAGVNPGDHHPALLATIITDGLMGFAVGLLIFTRIEMYLRAKRLLAGERDPA
ncbi:MULTISPECIES: CcdC protein domain-containing protein [Sphingomonas]|uniref:CcdC protein domain-containing protein n=1 Tax=Sphingomonas TaxID=13687 RepID=UPI000DEFAF52|nr:MULTISPECIES: CcdC protein domain-containing protein [Sphingomonas]